MKEIKFNSEGQYHGRNGYGKAVGMAIAETPSGNFVSLKPINT